MQSRELSTNLRVKVETVEEGSEATILNMMDSKGLTEKVRFTYNPEVQERAYHVNAGKGILGRGRSWCKGLETLDRNNDIF